MHPPKLSVITGHRNCLPILQTKDGWLGNEIIRGERTGLSGQSLSMKRRRHQE